MATTWISNKQKEPGAAEWLENKLAGALAVNRAMETALVDVIAAYTPWLAPIIPASIGWYNVQNVLHFLPWQAWVYAIVVECLGLATVSTALKFWSWNQDSSEKRAPFWLALLTALFYLGIVLAVNVLLDEGDPTIKLVKALASSFSVVGALVVAMRSQQARAEQHLEQVKAEVESQRQAFETQRARDEMLRLEMARIESQKELERLKFEREKELETLRLQAEERQKEKEAERNFKKELKLAEINLKVAEAAAKVSKNGSDENKNFPKDAETFGKAAETGGKLPESFGNGQNGGGNFPETFGKFTDWRDVPVEQRQRIAGMPPKQVRLEYGTSEKTSSNWVRNALAEFGEVKS